MIKRFIIRGVSKKFKGVQKLKPQKVISIRSSAETGQRIADEQARAVLGEVPRFRKTLGMSDRSITELAARDLAFKTSTKKWDKFIPKITKRQRSSIASFAKKHKGKVSLKGIKKAKEQAFTRTLKIADKKQSRIFRQTHERFTGRSVADPFKTIWKKLDKPIKW